jgi:hypothetical protein
MFMRRRKIMDELNYLRTNRKISASWSMDGRLFAIGLNSNSVQMIKGIDDTIRLGAPHEIGDIVSTDYFFITKKC